MLFDDLQENEGVCSGIPNTNNCLKLLFVRYCKLKYLILKKYNI